MDLSKSFKIKINSAITIMLVAWLSVSCVGTVKDQNAQSANVISSGSKSTPISFDGLQFVNPVSHDKIELYFAEAETDAAEVIYEIYVNNSPTPIKVSNKSLNKTAQGLFLFTVTNLNINSVYSFNMRAVPAGEVANSTLDPSQTKYATTFSNETANFLGIGSLQVSAGEAGRTSVVLKWTAAGIKGTNLNPRDSDPVQYEITYISSLGRAANLNNTSYTGADRKVILTPTPLASPPGISKINTFTVSQLAPGTTYYFQVRAIHKGYITYGSDSMYRREMNTRYLAITTLSNTGVFDFQPSLVNLSSPQGETGLTSFDVSWAPASGEYYNYKVCLKKVAGPTGSASIIDQITDDDLVTMLNNSTYCVNKTADLVSHRFTGLESYAYYQAKVIACRTINCGPTERIKSALLQRRVTTNIAQFNGISELIDPQNENSLDEISIKFESPLVGSGYLNQFKLYCYNSATDTSPVELSLNGTASSGTGKSKCDGITSLTTLPNSLSNYSSFSEISLKLNHPIDGTINYCFSLVPAIDSPYLHQENLEGAVVRCFSPQIKTPTILQFSGKDNLCQTNTGKDLSITWNLPTGGLYSKYVIFYKVKTAANDFFNFAQAEQAYLTNNVGSVYKWVDEIDKNLSSAVLNNLIPGKTYSVGVLTYLTDGVTKRFSQYNINVDDCSLPLPKAKFDEWVDVFAIGPKEDGMTPVSSTGNRRMILETLDDDGIPVEAKVLLTDDKTLDTTDSLMTLRSSSTTFDGVYGSKAASDTNPIQQYSNSGIVKIAWKDISLFNNTETLSTYIGNALLEPTPNTKTSRKFGYKVYRSDDNQLTWVELTSRSINNKFQTTLNSGLLHPISMQFRKRNNLPLEPAQNIVSFIDYSVKFSDTAGEVDKARIYYYKVIPVFDSKELVYEDSNNPTHHIIKVTLPPRNMALVHRMMANRTLCIEIDKTISKNLGDNYSCEFNGVGSSGKSKPWVVGQTLIDQGGDLLIDRFELSCPITRGDNNKDNSDSLFSGALLNFNGMSDFSNNYKGCFHTNGSTYYEPNIGGFAPSENYSFKQMIPGDCTGTSAPSRHFSGSGTCSNPALAQGRYLLYPGSEGLDYLPNCTDANYNLSNFADESNPTSGVRTMYPQMQSEYAAVYYSRSHEMSWRNWGQPISKFTAASGQTLNVTYSDIVYSNCSVNVSYVNNSGQYRPRWIGVDKLFGGLSVSGNTITLWNKTINQIRANTYLYDSTNVKAPDSALLNQQRFNPSSTPLARVVSANSSKLPPLRGLTYNNLQNICSTYKVQVGFEPKGKSFVNTEPEKNKNLARRRESIIAAAWPLTYDQTKVNTIENGTYSESSVFKGCIGSEREVFSGVRISGDTNMQKGDYYYPNMATTRTDRTFIFGGSSTRDGNGGVHSLSSEKCVSKFGVQDIPGNMYDVNSDELFCDYSQDKLYLGLNNSVLNSVLRAGDSTGLYDPNSLIAWVLGTPDSGSCSLVETGAARNGQYVTGAGMTEIYSYSGVNTSVISRAKVYDQKSVLTARNGDGSFLDFGQENLATRLSDNNSLSLTNNNVSYYFNTILGIPLTCEKGCADNSAEDNRLVSADVLSAANGYNSGNNPKNISILDFPVNNSVIVNTGVSTIADDGAIDTSNPNEPAVNYYSSFDAGALPADPLDNFLNMSTLVPGSGNPTTIHNTYFRVSRGGTLKFFTGGYFLSDPGRYSLNVADWFPDNSTSGRCSVMINENN